jgi:type III secretion system HrpE/YscL family protein
LNGARKDSASKSGLASALSEAQSIIEAAQERASEITSEAERKFKEAQENGYRQGFNQGLADASRKSVRLIEESTEVAERLAEEGAKLAIAIAGTVIGEHIKIEPDVAKKIAMRAIQESVIGENVTLVICPDDEAVMNQSLGQLRRVAGNAAVNIETDPSFSRGSCMVRTDFGEIDATIETLLLSIRERLGIVEDEK